MTTLHVTSSREGEVWINDDQPSCWVILLVVRSESCYHHGTCVGMQHHVLILETGGQSGYKPGDVDRWYEHNDEPPWSDGFAYMRRVA